MSSTTQNPGPTPLFRRVPQPDVKGVSDEEVAKTKALVDENIRKSSGLTKDQELEALEREIALKERHLDLTELEKGKYPDRLIAEHALSTGIWKVVALILDIIRRVW